MEENKIYEALHLINDHSDIDTELIAAKENLQNIFRKKYIGKLYSAVNESRHEAECHPTKEVILLKALKGYASEKGCTQLDGLIGTFNFLNTIKNINSSLTNINDHSINALSAANQSYISSSSVNITKALLLLALIGKL